MGKKLGFHLSRISRAIWFLPAVFSLLAVTALVVSAFTDPFFGEALISHFDLTVIDRILDILASSMLAVSIFSLTTMVAAIRAATQAATPRVRSLVIEDRTAQTVISIFIGTFLFSLLGVIGLSGDVYGPSGRLVLFVLTLAIIVAVVVTLIRWIQKLSSIGAVGETVDRAEVAARKAFRRQVATAEHGGRRGDRVPEGARPIVADRIGYVQRVDGARLGDLSEKLDVDVHLVALPGTYVDLVRPLAWVAGEADDAACDSVRRAFVVADDRTFDTDPRFGLTVLAEIGLRALSPAINDPGTAIDVIDAQTRVLHDWGAHVAGVEPEAEVKFPRLFVSGLDADELFADAFAAIARDGAGCVEVHLTLQQRLATLAAAHPDLFEAPARRMSREAFGRARAAMGWPPDVERLEAAAAAVGGEWVGETVTAGDAPVPSGEIGAEDHAHRRG